MKRDEGGPIPPHWELRCLQCGYDLTGLIDRVCPECGTPFSPRQTWEANQQGVVPAEEKPSVLAGNLVVVAVLLTILGIALATGSVAAYAAVVLVLICESIVRFTEAGALPVRLLFGFLCLLLIMWALIP